MVACVIFWSAVFAIIFFVLGTFFKALASAFNALLTSLGRVLAISGLAGGTGVVLYLLYAIIGGINEEGFWTVIGPIVFIIIVIGFIVALIGGFGEILLEIVVALVENMLIIVSEVLEWAADLCERKYIKFLKVIIRRLDKC